MPAIALRCVLSALLVAAQALGLQGCGGGGSSSVNSITPAPVTTTPPVNYAYAGTLDANQSITSKTTGITYPFHVYLPPGYAGSGRSYPLLVATDGQWIFPSFSRMVDQRKKDLIVVAIEQGPGDRRATDYTNAGATAYIQFLKTELLPRIEANYRTSGMRSFVGTSYGGLLGSILLSRETVGTPYFRNYLLFDGAFWALNLLNIQDEVARYSASSSLPVQILLTSANSPGNESDVNLFQSRYTQRQYQGITLQRKSFNIAHNDVADPSFDWAIDLL